MEETKRTYNLLIASYLEPHHVEKIRNVNPRINVLYEPTLIAPQRFPADHIGGPFHRSGKQEKQWKSLLKIADILFDFDRTHYKDLPELAPNVKWIQTTSSGIGQIISRMKYNVRMSHTIFTSAKGVHAQPLAEFCLMVMLAFNKKLLPMIKSQKNRHWERFA